MTENSGRLPRAEGLSAPFLQKPTQTDKEKALEGTGAGERWRHPHTHASFLHGCRLPEPQPTRNSKGVAPSSVSAQSEGPPFSNGIVPWVRVGPACSEQNQQP